MLKPYFFQTGALVYTEGDQANSVHFVKEGLVCFVLPAFNQTPFVKIPKGQLIGFVDIQASSLKSGFDIFEWPHFKKQIKRQFSIRAQNECELMRLAFSDLEKMPEAFSEYYNEMI